MASVDRLHCPAEPDRWRSLWRDGRTVSSLEELNQLIGNWNNTRAGRSDAYGSTMPSLATLPDDGSVRFGDSKISQDIRVSKSFRIKENVSIEWIGEVFNLFNVANLIGYNTQRIRPTTSDCAAAACTSSEISSLGFLQPTDRATSVFGFGGPRAFQFALRVVF